jgi:hypothetical protein
MGECLQISSIHPVAFAPSPFAFNGAFEAKL